VKRFLILYTISGIFGFVLGGNFALTGLASMGASGAIFGTHAAVLVDLIWHWKYFERPKRMLFALIFEIIVGFGLGGSLHLFLSFREILPGFTDNFGYHMSDHALV
jgi:membrane associated rhomboid family serine protease